MSLKTVATAFAATFVSSVTALAADQIETPSFEVLQSADGVELRRYAPVIVAEVTVEAANRDEASSKGFRPLAGYIFGQNRDSDKIAMTAPVTTEATDGGIPTGDGTKIDMTAPVTTGAAEDGTYTVRFTMPSKWTMETLPQPVNEAVELKEVGERLMLAAGFTGERTDERIAETEGRLAAYAEANGVKAEGPYTTAGYDGPDTPVSERRWEVLQLVSQ